jgi:hypothetical protein
VVKKTQIKNSNKAKKKEIKGFFSSMVMPTYKTKEKKIDQKKGE